MDNKTKHNYYASISMNNEFTTSDNELKVEMKEKGIISVYSKNKFVGAIENTTASQSVIETLILSYEKALNHSKK